jgi:hypothetical protein
MRRSGGFLAGLLPAVHLTLAVPALAATGIIACRGPRSSQRSLAVFLGAGLLVSAAVALIPLWFGGGHRPAAPYIVSGDSALIREQFRLMTDFHRRELHVSSFGYLLNVTAFLSMAGLLGAFLREGTDARRAELTGFLIAVAVAWAIVVAGLAEMTGARLPEFVHAVMPMRFTNYSAVLVLSFTAAALHRATGALAGSRRAVALAVLALFVLLTGILRLHDSLLPGGEIVVRYPLFCLWAILLAFVMMGESRSRRRIAIVCAVALTAALVTGKRDPKLVAAVVGVAVAAGAALRVGALVCSRWSGLCAVVKRAGLPLLAAGVLTGCVTMLAFDRAQRVYGRGARFDIMSDEDVRIREWLSGNAAPGELVLSAMLPRALIQTKTGHPVLLETETLWLMTYMPSIAPVVAAMVRDLYGVDYTNPSQLRTLCPDGKVGVYICPVWFDIWKRRTRDEWQSLAAKYHFRLVVCGADVPLQLRPGFVGERLSVYIID